MTEATFWEIINTTCGSDPYSVENWHSWLIETLETLPPSEIVEWGEIFNRLTASAYRVDLWAAAYLINGGASDDGFYYFRCWLVGMGQTVYEATIRDPDHLADVARPTWWEEGINAEAEIYSVARLAWSKVTGKGDEDFPDSNVREQLVGEFWDFDNQELMRKYLPRLAANFYDAE